MSARRSVRDNNTNKRVIMLMIMIMITITTSTPPPPLSVRKTQVSEDFRRIIGKVLYT
jgi:hypothetical protein